MKENFPNLVKEIDMPVQEAQRVPNKMNGKRPAPRHIIIKMPKVKDQKRILKAAREKPLLTYKGALIRLSADNPPNDLHTYDSVPILLVCLLCLFVCFYIQLLIVVNLLPC